MNNFHLTFQKAGTVYHVDFCAMESAQVSAAASANFPCMLGGREYSLKGETFALEIIQSCQQQHGVESSLSTEDLSQRLKSLGAEDISFSRNINAVGIEVLEVGKSFNLPASIEEICTLINDHYIFPETAEQCSVYLRKQLQAGVYDQMQSPQEFAEKVTIDLQSIAQDAHLSVVAEREVEETEEEMIIKLENCGYGFISRAGVTSPGNHHPAELPLTKDLKECGYLEFWAFKNVSSQDSGAEKYGRAYQKTKQAISLAMEDVVETHPKLMIIDLRNNCGGSPYGVQLLCSYFLPENILLNTIKSRKCEDEETCKIEEFRTLSYAELPLEKRLLGIPVYVLTSHHTFSAGEECANNLRVLNSRGMIQATVIGETTAGGANPCVMHAVNEDFAVFIPNRQSINPYDGSNWERKGVTPDYHVPAEYALNKVIELRRSHQQS